MGRSVNDILKDINTAAGKKYKSNKETLQETKNVNKNNNQKNTDKKNEKTQVQPDKIKQGNVLPANASAALFQQDNRNRVIDPTAPIFTPQKNEMKTYTEFKNQYSVDNTEKNARAAQKADRDFVNNAKIFVGDKSAEAVIDTKNPRVTPSVTPSLKEIEKYTKEIRDMTPEKVQSFLDRDESRRKELKANAGNYDYNEWLTELADIKKRKEQYHDWLKNYKPTGKDAFGDRGLSDIEFDFKMRSMTENDARGFEEYYRNRSKDKNLPYSERAISKAVADNYHKLYRNIKYDNLKYRPDFEEKSAQVDRNMARYANIDSNSDRLSYILGFFEVATEDEMKIFNYLLNVEGSSKAEEYVKENMDEITRRHLENAEKKAYDFGKGHKYLAAPVSAFTNLVGTVPGLIGDINYMLNDGITSDNNKYWAFTKDAQSMRAGGLESIKSDTGKKVYNIVNSVLDNAAALLVSKGIGAGLGATAKATNAITTVAMQTIMSSNAATSKIIECDQKGMSKTKSMTMGIIVGAVEALTEKYSIEAILNNPSTIGKALLQNSFTEGTEEVAGNWAERAIDVLINANDAEVSKVYNNYIAQGMDEREALAQTIYDCVKDDEMAFISGAVSGLLMTGVHMTTQAIGEGGFKNLNAQLRESEYFNNLSQAEQRQYFRQQMAQEILSNDEIGKEHIAAALDALAVPDAVKVANEIEQSKKNEKVN